jgi:hypothetical protein
MSNTTKQLLPSQIGCIDREWVEQEINTLEDHLRHSYPEYVEGWKGMIASLKSLKKQLFPIEPIMEDAINKGVKLGKENNYWDIEGSYYYSDNDNIEYDKDDYLTQHITIKLEDNE